MFNRLKKLLRGESTHSSDYTVSAPAKGQAKKKKTPSGFALDCSLPIGQKKTPQPLSVLKKLVPINTTSEQDLAKLAHKTFRYSEGAVVFLQGKLADSTYYILQGTIELHPDTEENYDLSITTPKQASASYQITADTPLAYMPLNSGNVFGATAIATTTVDILTVSNELSYLWTKITPERSTDADSLYIDLPDILKDNHFFISFAKAYQKNTIQLPSLPNVALKLRNAMQREISARETVEIIQLDPAIATKLIQVANSSLYAPFNPIKNCHDAVVRLGMTATRNLVMGISLKQLFHCKNKNIMAHMQQAWKQSLLVSSLCFVLAEEVGTINPEEALLAGLMNDIGIIPLLHYAEQHADEYPDIQEIIDILPHMRAPVGRLVLNSLDFSDDMSEIAYASENWFYDSGEDIQLIDIVILAKLHSYLRLGRSKELPYINSIPAYAKLKNGKLSPDFSLSVLHKAQERINATMSILS